MSLTEWNDTGILKNTDMKNIVHNEPVRKLFNPQITNTYHGVTIAALIVTLWEKCGIHIEFDYDY